MKNLIKVEIVRETTKAKLVAFESQQVWVQNRSFKDGFVKKELFAKKVQETAQYNKDKEAYKEFMSAPIPMEKLVVVKETDKAVCIRINVDFCDIEKDKSLDLWFPKSWTLNRSTINRKAEEKINEIWGNKLGSWVLEYAGDLAY